MRYIQVFENLIGPVVNSFKYLMAQQGSCIVYQETENDHLKLVGKLFNQCHDTLVQLGTFLASNLSQDDYTNNLPSIEQLLTEFHVNADLAFFHARPMFNHLINTKYGNRSTLKNFDDSCSSPVAGKPHCEWKYS